MKKLIFTLVSLIFLIPSVYGADTIIEKDEPITVDTEMVSECSKGAGEVQAIGLNLRENPNEESKVLTTLSENDVMIVYEKIGDWYCVGVDGIIGYVFADYVDFSGELDGTLGYGKADRDVVNVRTEAGVENVLAAAIQKDTLVEIKGVSSDWYKVKVNGVEGYIRSDLIDLVDSEQSKIIQENNSLEKEEIVAEKAVKTTVQSNENSQEEKKNEPIKIVEEILVEDEPIKEELVEGDNGGAPSSDIVSVAQNYLDVPYVWGGTSPSGFDCSGFTQYVFNECGYPLSRIASAQYNDGTPISYSELASGDLVFFTNTYSTNGISHVGIYMGGGEFIHAANGGVKISSLSENYYSSRYYGACRIG